MPRLSCATASRVPSTVVRLPLLRMMSSSSSEDNLSNRLYLTHTESVSQSNVLFFVKKWHKPMVSVLSVHLSVLVLAIATELDHVMTSFSLFLAPRKKSRIAVSRALGRSPAVRVPVAPLSMVSLLWRVPHMAGVTDGFWFFNPMCSRRDKADCGRCCRSSMRIKCIVGQHPMCGSASRRKTNGHSACFATALPKIAATGLTSNNVFSPQSEHPTPARFPAPRP